MWLLGFIKPNVPRKLQTNAQYESTDLTHTGVVGGSLQQVLLYLEHDPTVIVRQSVFQMFAAVCVPLIALRAPIFPSRSKCVFPGAPSKVIFLKAYFAVQTELQELSGPGNVRQNYKACFGERAGGLVKREL